MIGKTIAVLAFTLTCWSQTSLVEVVVSQADFHTRLEAVHLLGGDLSEAEHNTLFTWLVTPTGEAGEATLKNDLLNVLRGRKQGLEQLAQGLRTMYADSRNSVVLRDYALQHLAAFTDNTFTDNTLTDNNRLFWQATDERNSSIAGTALLALARRGETSDRLAQKALEVAADPSAAEFARIPALRVCGRLRYDGAAQLARTLMTDGKSISLKMAAVATLGELGDRQDIPSLEAIRHGAQPRLVPAAERALKLIEEKAQLWSGS